MRNYQYGKTSKQHLSTVSPILQTICMEAQRIANEANPDIYIPDWGYSEGLRTTERQEELFALGRYKPGKIVTNCDGEIDRSIHQLGEAIDFFAYVNGAASYKPEDLQPVALCHMQAAAKLGYFLQWGGLFGSFNDSPHIELMQ